MPPTHPPQAHTAQASTSHQAGHQGTHRESKCRRDSPENQTDNGGSGQGTSAQRPHTTHAPMRQSLTNFKGGPRIASGSNSAHTTAHRDNGSTATSWKQTRESACGWRKPLATAATPSLRRRICRYNCSITATVLQPSLGHLLLGACLTARLRPWR